jgi:hypothetical protein
VQVQVKKAKSAWFRALRAARLSSSANRAAPDNFSFFVLQAPRGGAGRVGTGWHEMWMDALGKWNRVGGPSSQPASWHHLD